MEFCNIGIFANNLEFLAGKTGNDRRCAVKLAYLTMERHNTVGSFHFVVAWIECNHVTAITQVGIRGTTAKSRKRKFVPSPHPGPVAVVTSSKIS